MNSAIPFYLQLLGTAKLLTADGTAVTGRAGQRHRLALLALLALAPRHSLNRDKLMLLLWPESDMEQARNLLKVSVYVVRQALGDGAIITDGDELRLNENVVGSDVADFEAAWQKGDHDRAAGLYQGPLLDGFFLGASPEFEQWLDHERARLAGLFAQALEGAAEAAEQCADYPQVIDLWKQRARLDPFDSRVAIRLMRALDLGGNPAAALQHATVHTRLLEAEFRTAPPAELLALAEAIRSRKEEPPPRDLPAASVAAAPSLPLAQPDTSITREPASRLRVGRRLIYLIPITAVFVGLLIFSAVRMRESNARVATANTGSIAVLPLTNLGSDPRNAALADGMSEEIIGMLSRSGDLRVIGSTSAFRFRDSKMDVQQIADSLGVSHLVEGSFQKIGSNLRVQVRLVAARDRSTVWSNTYDSEYTDVFAVQNDIASSVAAALRELLARRGRHIQPSSYTPDVVAYEYYLRGIDRSLLRTDSGARAGIAYLKQAIARDSTFAAAYAGLARLAFRNGMDELGHSAARRAIALDDSLSEARSALGAAHLVTYRFADAEKELHRALELDPANLRAHEFLVHLYVFTERPREALAQAQSALQTDPLSPTTIAELSRALMVNNRCDEALDNLKRIASFRPRVGRAIEITVQCYVQQGRFEEAIGLLEQNENRPGQQSAALAYLLARSGQRQRALQIRDSILGRRSWRQAYELAVVYTGLRDFDNAFSWIDRAIDDHSLRKEIMEPMFAELRSDPRFDRVRDRLGLQKR